MSKLITGSFIFVIALLILITPVVATFETITKPVQIVVDFISDIVEFEGNDIKLEDINPLIDSYYLKCAEKQIIDEIMLQYSDHYNVNHLNLLKPFVFTQCKEITSENLTIIADLLSTQDIIENEMIVNFLLNTSPFKEQCKKLEITYDNLIYLYDSSRSNDLVFDGTVSEKIVSYASSKLGCRYWWGASGPNYFDCSGLIFWVFNQSGITVPRTTAYGYANMGTSISYSQLEPGDIITFDYGSGSIDHCGIYIGDGKMINALGKGSGTVGQYPEQCVKISSVVPGSYFYKNIFNCRRLY